MNEKEVALLARWTVVCKGESFTARVLESATDFAEQIVRSSVYMMKGLLQLHRSSHFGQ